MMLLPQLSSILLKKMLTSNLSLQRKLQRSLLAHRTKYIYIFFQGLEPSFCGSTNIDHCVGNKTIHLELIQATTTNLHGYWSLTP